MSDPVQPFLSIITPSWNRRPLLPRLYQSLLHQNAEARAFEWLVIDDGSTDGTAEYLEGLASESRFPLRVIRRQNGGKHRAINAAAQLMAGKWCMIVDSDDILVEGRLHAFIAFLKEIDHDRRIGAVVSKMAFVNGDYEATNLDGLKRMFRYYERAYLSDRIIDCTFSFKRDAIRMFPYPEVEGETFMAHGWLPYAMSERFFTTFYDETLVIAEYQADGVSKNSLTVRARNPVSAMHVYRMLNRYPQPLRRRIKFCVNFWRYYAHAAWVGKSSLLIDIPKPWPNVIYRAWGFLAALSDRCARR